MAKKKAVRAGKRAGTTRLDQMMKRVAVRASQAKKNRAIRAGGGKVTRSAASAGALRVHNS